jgi:hypothetical protein
MTIRRPAALAAAAATGLSLIAGTAAAAPRAATATIASSTVPGFRVVVSTLYRFHVEGRSLVAG